MEVHDESLTRKTCKYLMIIQTVAVRASFHPDGDVRLRKHSNYET